jgi:hypothetical protein
LLAVEKEGGGGEGSDFFFGGAGACLEVDGDEGGALEVGLWVGDEVGSVAGGLPARGFGGLLGDGEDLVEVSGLHGAEGDGERSGVHGAAEAGDLGFEKISASERRR